MLNTPMKVQWHKTTNFICFFKPVNMRAFFNFSVVQHIINKNTKLAIYAKLSQSSARSAIACTDQLSIFTQNGNCYRRAPTVNCSSVCVCALWIVAAEQGVAAASTFAYHKMACEQQQQQSRSSGCGREGREKKRK